jgi:hypothetical protein
MLFTWKAWQECQNKQILEAMDYSNMASNLTRSR